MHVTVRQLIALIDRQIAHAKAGKDARTMVHFILAKAKLAALIGGKAPPE